MKSLERYAIKVPEPCIELTEEGLDSYFRATQQLSHVRGISNGISNALKETTGFSSKNIPDELNITHFNFGGIEGEITSNSRPNTSFKPVHDRLSHYFQDLAMANRKFIRVDEIITRYDNLVKDFTKKSLVQEIKLKNREDLQEIYVVEKDGGIIENKVPPTTFFPSTIDFRDLTRESIVIREKANHIADYLSTQIVIPFNVFLKEKAAEYLGVDLKNLQETEKTILECEGTRAFDVQIITRPSTSYAKALREVKNTLECILEDEYSAFREDFELRKIKNKEFISLNDIIEELDESIKKHTTSSIRFEQSYNPILEFATAIV